MKKSVFIKSAILRFMASAFPILIIQILIFPSIAQNIDSGIYGFILTVYSFFSLVPGTLGNSLLNLRLVHDTDWGHSNEQDFSILLVIVSTASFLFGAIFLLVYNYISILSALLLCTTAAVWCIREYALVKYLCKVDYVSYLKNSLVMCFGYALGYALFRVGCDWAVIFLLGQLASLVFLRLTTKIFSIKRPSSFFSTVVKEASQLTFSGFLLRAVTYCDRLVLYPLIGGTSVAIYYAATLVSKIINMIAVALNSVVLTSLAKKPDEDKHSFYVTLGSSFVICVVCYVIIVVAAPVILGVLYPQFLSDALPLVPVTAAASLLAVVTSLISPYVLRFRSMKWQIVGPLTSLVLYLTLALTLFLNFGLIGFAVGALLAELCKLIVQMIIYIFAQ